MRLALYLVDWPTVVLQCFDAVGWIISPVKVVLDMTYNVFGGTLNPTLPLLAFIFGVFIGLVCHYHNQLTGCKNSFPVTYLVCKNSALIVTETWCRCFVARCPSSCQTVIKNYWNSSFLQPATVSWAKERGPFNSALWCQYPLGMFGVCSPVWNRPCNSVI